MNSVQFVYEAYIASTPEKVWNALFDPALTSQYWQHENRSDWKKGSRWEHVRSGKVGTVDLVGTVVQYAKPKRLVVTWAFPEDEKKIRKQSRLTIDIKPFRGIVLLRVTHDHLEKGSSMLEGITEGWPKVVSSLKTLLETKKPLPRLW
jgi:uncharacterized protein YndB with AHSA1/START domain